MSTRRHDKARPYSGDVQASETAEEDAELTHVEPATPCGEYLRRFWHPVALVRKCLRRAIRDVEAGEEPPRGTVDDEGVIPTVSGDVIFRLAAGRADDRQGLSEIGRLVSLAVIETRGLAHAERRREIERRVKAEVASGA